VSVNDNDEPTVDEDDQTNDDDNYANNEGGHNNTDYPAGDDEPSADALNDGYDNGYGDAGYNNRYNTG
jgi:hypothetical protein